MQHRLSFRNRNYSNSMELSKHIWTLKDNNTNFTINWSILATAPAYRNRSQRCHLCLTEKLHLIRTKRLSLLNKRTELISKCCHKNKFYLANFTSCQQQLYRIFISHIDQIITLVNLLATYLICDLTSMDIFKYSMVKIHFDVCIFEFTNYRFSSDMAQQTWEIDFWAINDLKTYVCVWMNLKCDCCGC